MAKYRRDKEIQAVEQEMKPKYEDTIKIDQSPKGSTTEPNKDIWREKFDALVYKHLSGEAEHEEQSAGPQRFKKKPVIIEAIHNTPENKEAIKEFLGNTEHAFTDEGLLIRTLEGVMKADEGDWIICGVSGEFYPVKEDIFEKTYDPIFP